jgi:hypothetical protein
MSDSLIHYESQTKAWKEKRGGVLVKIAVFKLRFGNDSELEGIDMFLSLRSLLCPLFSMLSLLVLLWSLLMAG